MKTSEGKKYTINLNEFDLELILIALGQLSNSRMNNKQPTKAIENVIERIYRAMGVRL